MRPLLLIALFATASTVEEKAIPPQLQASRAAALAATEQYIRDLQAWTKGLDMTPLKVPELGPDPRESEKRTRDGILGANDAIRWLGMYTKSPDVTTITAAPFQQAHNLEEALFPPAEAGGRWAIYRKYKLPAGDDTKVSEKVEDEAPKKPKAKLKATLADGTVIEE